MPNAMIKKICFILILVFTFLLLTISFCYVNGVSEYSIARNNLDASDYKGAVTHFARAINWYLPYVSYVNESAENIIKIASMYESQENVAEAKYTYMILRGALYSVRSAYSPGERYLIVCNERIAELSSRKNDGTDAGAVNITKKEERLNLLNEDVGGGFWTVISSLTFILWVTAMLYLIMQIFKNNVVKLNSNAIITILLLTTSYIIWLISLVKT